MRRAKKKRSSGRLKELFPEKFKNQPSVARLTMRTRYRFELAQEAVDGGFTSLTEYVEEIFSRRGALGGIYKHMGAAK